MIGTRFPVVGGGKEENIDEKPVFAGFFCGWMDGKARRIGGKVRIGAEKAVASVMRGA